MPLSEHEQRILAEIERRLLEDDPKFAQQVSSSFKAHLARRMKLAVLGFVAGIVVVLLGVVASQNPVLSLAGFLLMIGSILFFVQALRRRAVADKPPSGGRTTPPPRTGRARSAGKGGRADGWWERMNERWRQRWEERGGPPER
jgi:Protein of unknown function (DUF3040)